MIASKKYKQDKKRKKKEKVAQDSHKCCTGTFKTLYSGNSQYVDTHFLLDYSHLYTIFIFLLKFSVSVCMCDRTDILLHTLLSVL